MIYITGDTHGDFKDRFESIARFAKEGDFVIICGDFGLIWDLYESQTEKLNRSFIESFSWTTCFVSGNHEGYDRLYELPIVDFHEGKARKISDKIYLLPRGEMFNIEDNKIFTFGGARSHDIWNLLDSNDKNYFEKRESLELTWEFFREIGISWWEDEIAREEEFRHGFETLKAHDFKCDYIISHEAPASDCAVLRRAGGVMSDYLEAIKRATDFKVWYYGHHHMNLSTGDKMQCLYENFMQIGDIRQERILGDSVHKKEVFNRRKLEQIIDKAKQEREDVLTGKYQRDTGM